MAYSTPLIRSQPKVLDHISAFLASVTTRPGVYTMLDKNGGVIYVGKAKNLKKRLSQYFTGTPDNKTQNLTAVLYRIEVTITPTEAEALLLENNMIKHLQPRFNVVFRDDKSYPYLALTPSQQYARISIHRGAQLSQAQYFGPYPHMGAVKASLQALQKAFLLRSCTDTVFKNRTRPCLLHQLKRCSAPCVDKISVEDYQKNVIAAAEFLSGRDKELVEKWIAEMEAAAMQLHFERAAHYRDQIVAIRQLQAPQAIIQASQQDNADVLAVAVVEERACIHMLFIRKGRILGSRQFFPSLSHWLAEGKVSLLESFIMQYYTGKALVDLPDFLVISPELPLDPLVETVLSGSLGQKLTIKLARGEKLRWLHMAEESAAQALHLEAVQLQWMQRRLSALQVALGRSLPIERLECFDVSHSQGEATMASCVVFNTQGPFKKEYRRFVIKTAGPGDDYAALTEAVRRRYTRLRKEAACWPDIIVVDGGPQQWRVTAQVLAELEMPASVTLIGISKGPNRQAGLETLHLSDKGDKLALAPESPGFHLLLHLRDESHRFALKGHKKRRAKLKLHSVLEGIPGIGHKRRQQLLQQLGGYQEVKQAGIQQLASIPGISLKLAERIYSALHGQ